MILTKQYRCVHSASCQCTKGHLSEDVLFLVFHRLNWNPKLIATLSCVCKWFDDLAKRVLWKEFCRTRAPKMMLDLQSSGSHSIDGNWRPLGKLLTYCSGCKRGGLFRNIQIPGHFVYRTRFSRTSGKSFLLPQCRNDVLYVSDPCEHLDQGEEGDLGFFRGIFKSFATSNVRRMLNNKAARLHPTEVCPYCKAKLWSMLQANMIPQSASCRLGSYEDCIEYYVCLNGHMLGICTLLPLSESDISSNLLLAFTSFSPPSSPRLSPPSSPRLSPPSSVRLSPPSPEVPSASSSPVAAPSPRRFLPPTETAASPPASIRNQKPAHGGRSKSDLFQRGNRRVFFLALGESLEGDRNPNS